MMTSFRVGPLTNFCVVPSRDEDQGDQLVACCGYDNTSSIRKIQAGLGANILVSTEPTYGGVNGVWALPLQPDAASHAYVVLAFEVETRILASRAMVQQHGGTDSQEDSQDSQMDSQGSQHGSETLVLVDYSHESGFDLQQSTLGASPSQILTWRPFT